jgi:hypothetical protein
MDTEDEVRLDSSTGTTTETNKRLEAQNEVLIAALAAGATDEDAGRLAGCSARTVRRRRHDDPVFAREVSQRRADRAIALAGRLTDMGPQAIEVLSEALGDGAPRVRLRAAELILTNGSRLRRAAELDDALEEVRTYAEELAVTYQELLRSSGKSPR